MASGDITNIEVLNTASSKTNPFWSIDSLPFSGNYINLKNFKSLNKNKIFDKTVLGYWEPTRPKSKFSFPYENIFELILHSGVQSGTIGENHFASTGDLLAAGFSNELANKYGYKYTATGANIGYNEIYIEGTGSTIYDLLGKEVQCVMISRFSDSGIVPFNNPSGFKLKKQKVSPNMLRYQFFLSTGVLTEKTGVNQKTSFLSVGTEANTENYYNLTEENNQFRSYYHSGVLGEELYGTFSISNTGNYRLRYKAQSLDPRIIISPYSPTGISSGVLVRAGVRDRLPPRKRFLYNKTISYSINTSGLNLNEEYTGYININGEYEPDVIFNLKEINIPIIYKVNNYNAQPFFDNFYFKYTGSHLENINAFKTWPIGVPISVYTGASGKYPKVTLGLTIYNIGSGVYGDKSLDKISSGFFKPCQESKMFWSASSSNSNIKILNNSGTTYFQTGISGSLPNFFNIEYDNQSGSFQNDIFFSIQNTGQITSGQIFSGQLIVNTNNNFNPIYKFPISIDYKL